jgi:hypothetical protein
MGTPWGVVELPLFVGDVNGFDSKFDKSANLVVVVAQTTHFTLFLHNNLCSRLQLGPNQRMSRITTDLKLGAHKAMIVWHCSLWTCYECLDLQRKLFFYKIWSKLIKSDKTFK